MTNATDVLLQPVWDTILEHSQLVGSPLFNILVPVGWYITLCVVFTVLDFLPSAQAYKIQKHKPVTIQTMSKALKTNIWTHLAFIGPVSVLQVLFAPPIPLPAKAPTVLTMIKDLFVLLVVFDFLYFWWHWSVHKWRYGYKTVHSFHHEYHSPFALVTQYVNPVELISTALMSALPPLIFGVHPIVNWSWLIISIFISVDAHSGFDFPWGLHNYIPFYGGAVTHDMHHQRPNTNYEPFFTYLDIIFKTAAPADAYDHKKNKNQ